MAAKQALLCFAIGMLVIIVETGLTDPDHLGVVDGGAQPVLVHMLVLVRIVRVDPDAGEHVVIALSGGDDVVPFALAGRDVEKASDTGLPRAIEHGVLLLDEALVIEVAV